MQGKKIEIDERDNCYLIGLKMTRKAIEYLSNGLIINNKLNNYCYNNQTRFIKKYTWLILLF